MGFEDILGKVSELAQTGVAKAKELTDVGVAKTKELAEISKLKVENATEQEAIKKAYLEIGKLYFAERGMAPEAPYTALCEKIAALHGGRLQIESVEGEGTAVTVRLPAADGKEGGAAV